MSLLLDNVIMNEDEIFERSKNVDDTKVLLDWEQGCGKTVAAIHNIYKNHKNVKKLLIICPSFVKYGWKKEIKKYWGFKDSDFFDNHKNQLRKKIRGKNEYNEIDYKVYIFNYDALRTNTYRYFIDYVYDIDSFYVIVDEPDQGFLNPNSHRTLAFSMNIGLYLTNNFKLLTGTPMANHPWEIFSILDTVSCYLKTHKDKIIDNIYHFKNYFFNSKKIFTNARTLENEDDTDNPLRKPIVVYLDFKPELKEHFYKEYSKFADIYTLEQWRKDNPTICLHDKQPSKRIYIEPDIKTQGYINLLEDQLVELYLKNGDNFLNEVSGASRRMKLQTLANGFFYYRDKVELSDEDYIEIIENVELDEYVTQDLDKKVNKKQEMLGLDINNLKLNTLLEILKSHEGESIHKNHKLKKQIVIFDYFNYSRNKTFKKLIECGYKVGNASDKNGDKAILAFQEGHTEILLANQKSAGAGLNLQNASISIYFSNSDDARAREQSLSRTYRPGQKEKCIYYDLVVENTVDSAILDSIENKKAFTDLYKDYIIKKARSARNG